ncbi:chromosome partitioning protein [Micromonospora sp. NBC_00330]|uniref:MinD/ParA family ATP-binding protein n=1 Tax=Micromonospora sp. NBC_00330 TaxID=2903585 RepID=UPI002E291A80|nr:chromosome partitioning protein [Micromonospora sp. NBC_00330]
MDENADRAQVPGQQPVPERDVEPLWPPDPGDRGAVPPWAAVAEQRGAPSPVTHPVTPPVAAPPIGRPPVPGQPGVAAQSPPSPSDYPSLSGAVPAPGGWGASGPSGVGSGWAPAQPSWPPPTDPAAASPPPAPPATGAQPTPPSTGPGGVDLNLPFTLDHPTAAADRPAAAAPADRPATAAASDRPIPAATASAASPNATDSPNTVDSPRVADSPTAAGPAPADPSAAALAAAGPASQPGGTAPQVGGPTPQTGRPTPQVGGPAPQAGGTAPQVGGPTPQPGQPAPQPGGPGADGSPDGPARPIAESPWAYPPQRPAGTTAPAQEEAGGTPPIPPPPVVPHAGPGQAHPGQPFIPGQAGPAQIPPPPDVTQFSNPPHGLAAPQQSPGQAGPGTPPPGPFPPSPGWYPPPWQQGSPGGTPGQPYQEADGVTRVPAPAYPDAAAYPDASWTPDTTAAPTAEDFARRRQVRPADPVATMGVRAVVNKMGLLRLSPGRHEQELKRDIEMVRRNFGGLRQVTVVNPKGGAGKTVAILLLAMTFGQKRGGYVLAWDNNETQGTLGMRAQQDFHARTVRDMLRDLGQFQGAHGRVGDLSQYVRSQGEGMFDVLASDESATGGEMLTAAAFAEIREVVSRFYKLIFVDTGNNVRAQNWQASMDATDQLVVTMSARNDSAETAARMLDHLEQSGRQRLVRQAVTVVSMPPSRKEIDLPAIQEHFAARTRAVLLAPYERLIDSGEPIRYGGLSSATRDAWLKIAAAVAEGL